MGTLLAICLFGVLALYLIDGNWKAGIVMTFIIGFLQDPIRKLTPGQPQWITAFTLLSFVLSGFVLYLRNNGSFNLRQITWSSPFLKEWIPVFITLIALQSANSFLRFGNIFMTALGAAFYIVPLLGIWVGYNVGCSPKLLKRLILLYLIISIFYALTVFLSYRGYTHPILAEVGEGIEIIFRYGFHAQGASGLWRTSEIASFHLATAACVSIAVAFSLRRMEYQIGTIVLAIGFSFLTILTGRRKAIVLIIAFLSIFLILFSRRSNSTTREKIISSILSAAGLAYVLYALLLEGSLGSNFNEYLERVFSTSEEIGERLQTQGINATLTALQISDGIGLGVGVGANLSNLPVDLTHLEFQSRAFVAEGGGGRVVLELGLPGIIIISIIGFFLIKLIIKNYKLMRFFSGSQLAVQLGLFSFVAANIALFFSASQLYSDPFVLVILSISFGTFLAIPYNLSHSIHSEKISMAKRSIHGSFTTSNLNLPL